MSYLTTIWLLVLAAAVPLPAIAGAVAPASPSGVSDPVHRIGAQQAEAEARKRVAVEIAAKLVSQFPDDAVSYALLSAAHHNRGNSDEAVKWLRKCLELDPDRADAYGMLALIASDKGDLEQTVAFCKKALTSDPSLRDVHFRLGRALMDLGAADELIPTMEHAVKRWPLSSESHYLLGQGYLQSRDYTKAKASLLRAIDIQPDHTQAHFALFTACARLGQQDEAARYRDRFHQLEASDRQAAAERNVGDEGLSGLHLVRKSVAKTYTGAAQIYLAHQEVAKAQQLMRDAARLDPDNADCRVALTALALQRGRVSEALRFFQELAREQPDNGVNHFYLGQLFYESRQFEAAERAYRKVTQLSPERAEGYRGLAEFYLHRHRNHAEVQTLVEKVVQLQPTGPNFFLLALACAKNEDFQGARAAMGRAVELAPKNADYRRFYERLKKGR